MLDETNYDEDQVGTDFRDDVQPLDETNYDEDFDDAFWDDVLPLDQTNYDGDIGADFWDAAVEVVGQFKLL
jgi:hypothetical protein